MGKVLFIAPEQAKKRKIKLRWKVLCLVLTSIIVLENIYILYVMSGHS